MRRTIHIAAPTPPLAALLAAAALSWGACSDPNQGGVGVPIDVGAETSFGDTDAKTSDDAPTADAPTADAPLPDGAAGCGDCAAPATCVDGWCVAPAPGGCTAGETEACYGNAAVMTCDATGTAFVPKPCPSSHQCLDGACKPVLCQAGTTFCEGLAAVKSCLPDGSGFSDPVPCPENEYCTSGKCTGACFADPKFGSYVGCSYWTVDLPNWPDPTITPTNPEDLPHALVISNPNEMDATITWEPPPGVTIQSTDNTVKAGESKVFMMPVLNTEGTGVSHKGIRFKSSRPILVHQFNPWKAIWSNDASLLLPESFLGSDYVILSWPTDPRGLIQFPIPGMPAMENVNGFFTVVGVHDDTEVTFQVTGRVAAGDKVAAMQKGAIQTVTINKGEILNVECEPATLFETCDLTGSTVSAKKPVAVFAGHESAAIANPTNSEASGYLDHLEEQMFPLHVLDQSYLAVKSKPRGNDPDLWRIQAAEANVTVTTNPPQPGVNNVTLQKRGDWVEVYSDQSFEIQATGKIQVGQYLIGSEGTTQGTGDPSLILAVPTQRYRDFYALTIPPGYDTNWVTIIKPVGATVSSAGGPVPASLFQTFGAGGWEYGYLELKAGVHKLAGDQPFGLVVYGYNGAMSYGFPGGMN